MRRSAGAWEKLGGPLPVGGADYRLDQRSCSRRPAAGLRRAGLSRELPHARCASPRPADRRARAHLGHPAERSSAGRPHGLRPGRPAEARPRDGGDAAVDRLRGSVGRGRVPSCSAERAGPLRQRPAGARVPRAVAQAGRRRARVAARLGRGKPRPYATVRREERPPREADGFRDFRATGICASRFRSWRTTQARSPGGIRRPRRSRPRRASRR
jgi:hypothetical protein